MDNLEEAALEPIAIIGMAGRFPGAKNVSEFWQNLCDGIESISVFTDEELAGAGIEQALLNDPSYVKAGFVLDDIEMFDASFFNFTPKEAEITDPQQRLFLECAWEAFENAGYDPERYEGLAGVYAGTTLSNYLLNNIISNRELLQSVGQFQLGIGNIQDFLATRISYKLNLKGPSINVNTACSTSLVAVHSACRGLLSYECDLAIAGGVSIQVPQKQGYLYQEGGIVSADGHTRAFDAKAQGSPFGNGVGVVVLKRLEEALADGDCIYAVIKGSAINNDGSVKVSYTAPSVSGQVKVIASAQAIAGFEPETITYIETHGTGTALGDPIEIRALKEAFGSQIEKKGFCAIGSVKTNVSHLNTAAGVTGLIKTVLALKHKKLPPSLHFEQPNPEIDFANSPFYVNTTLREWKTDGIPRRAGVSSFGIGGTNAHVVLEEAPTVERSALAFGNAKGERSSAGLRPASLTLSQKSRPWQLLMVSAKTSSALETASANLAEHLKQHSDLNLADVAYTLQVGRQAFEHRRAVVCRDIQDALVALQNPKRVLSSIQKTNQPIAFMFPGLGTHYIHMGWELYQVPTFRETVDRCCEFLKPLLGLDLRDVLYPGKDRTDLSYQETSAQPNSSNPRFDLRKLLARAEGQADEATQKLNQTFLAQPSLFIIEYALAQLWRSWGIHPQALLGYSIGEYVAACLSGVLSLEDALTLVTKRAQMIQELPGGAMLAIPLSEQEVQPLLGENLCLSAIQSSSLCVLSGSTDAVEELTQQLTETGLAYCRLQTSHAFHSTMMEPIVEPLIELVKTFNLQPPKIPYLSNVTGTWITAAQATDPSYWAKHMCQPVRFAEGIAKLQEEPERILLEVGPGGTLSALTVQHPDRATQQVVLSSLRHPQEQQSDIAFLLNTLGRLWLAGVPINWTAFYADEQRQRIPLPTYPFERKRYWIDSSSSTVHNSGNNNETERKEDITKINSEETETQNLSLIEAKTVLPELKNANEEQSLADSEIHQLIQQQIEIMSQHLELLKLYS